MHIKIFNKEKEFIAAALKQISSLNDSEKTAQIGLSGGTTPENLYKEIAKKIPLKNAKIFQVDERYIPKENPDSNYRLIKDTILSNNKNQPKSFHYFDTSLPKNKALAKYEKELPNEPLDLIILGIGPDGHTASLSPNSPALISKKKAEHTTTKDFTIKDRLTITFPIILQAKKLLILLKGKEKQELLNKLITSKISEKEFPAKKLLKHQNLEILLLAK